MKPRIVNIEKVSAPVGAELGSKKLGVIAGSHGGRPASEDSIRHFTRLENGVDYWDGESESMT